MGGQTPLTSRTEGLGAPAEADVRAALVRAVTTTRAMLAFGLVEMCPGETVHDVRRDDKIDQVGIELFASAVANDRDRRVDAASLPIAAIVRERVEGVGDRYHARFERNLVTAQMARISAPSQRSWWAITPAGSSG